MPKRGFFIHAPPHETLAANKERRREHRMRMDARPRSADFTAIFRSICSQGLGKFFHGGFVLDHEAILEYLGNKTERGRHLTDLDRAYYGLMDDYEQMLNEPRESKKAAVDKIKIIQQLIGLGHPVEVRHKNQNPPFVRLATSIGAQKKYYAIGKNIRDRTFWARDEMTRMRGTTIIRTLENPFSEGGRLVLAAEEKEHEIYFVNDALYEHYPAEVLELEKKGVRFIPVPGGLAYQRGLSSASNSEVYFMLPHIDYSIGAIPEKKIVAVDSLWAQMNLNPMHEIAKIAHKVVLVPRGESRRNPANFLPLGGNKVLVDSGSPEFIRELGKAGAEVIPTVIPLDNITLHQGGLHCLFNEL
jgi:hypothetical protein